MSRFSALLILSLAALVAIWQVCVEAPAIPKAVSCVVLILSALLAGLRIGADHASRFVCDLERKNRYLAEESRQIAELNLHYLREKSK